MEIDRDKIQDSAYRQVIAQYLAGKWLRLLSPFSNDPCVFLPLTKITQEELDYCLDMLALNELDASTVSARLLKRMAFILVDSNPTYQAVSKDVLTSFQKSMEVHLAEISSKADEAIASIRVNLQVTKDRIDAALAESNEKRCSTSGLSLV